MAINTYGVKTGEFGQYDIADFRPLSLSVFKNNGGLARSCNQVVWNMGRKKRTPVKKPKRPPPKKLKMSAKGGHDRSFQKRMEIAILASRGVKPAEIVKAVGCTFDMAIRWSDRSEEVMQTGSVQSKRKGKVGPKPIFATPSAKKKLYRQLKGSTQKKLAKKLTVSPKVSPQNQIQVLWMRRFEGLSVGLAEPEVVLFLIESRKHRSSMTGSESNESLTPTTVL